MEAAGASVLKLWGMGEGSRGNWSPRRPHMPGEAAFIGALPMNFSSFDQWTLPLSWDGNGFHEI